MNFGCEEDLSEQVLLFSPAFRREKAEKNGKKGRDVDKKGTIPTGKVVHLDEMRQKDPYRKKYGCISRLALL